MAEAKIEKRSDGGFLVSGDMTFATTPKLLEISKELFRQTQDLRLDLSGVEQADSASLALLLEWLVWTRENGGRLSVRGLPEAMLALARLCQLEAELQLLGSRTSS